MDSKIYQGLLVMLLALQHQFRSFMEHRPELMKVMNMDDDDDDQGRELTYQRALDYLNQDRNMYHDLGKGRTNQQAVDLDSDGLNQLTELEEQSFVLEENLRSAIIEILRSQSCISRWWRDVRNLQRRLTNLQEELRAAIETLGGSSTGRYRKRIFSDRWSMLQHKNQVRERCPLRFQSCPNIPSVHEDEGFDLLRKSESLNRTIVFKDSLEDILEAIYNDLNFLDKFRQNTMMKWNFQQAAGQGNKSDSSEVRETACNATSHSSDQSGQHHVNATEMGHTEQHRDTEDDSPFEHHHSPRNNPDVLPSPQDTEDDSPFEHHHSHRNNPDVSPSQSLLEVHDLHPIDSTNRTRTQRRQLQRHPRAHNVTSTTTDTTTPNSREGIQSRSSQNVSEISRSGASAQPDNESQSPGARKTVRKKVPTTGTKTKSSGSPSFSLTNISAAIYKTVAASCAAIFIFISF